MKIKADTPNVHTPKHMGGIAQCVKLYPPAIPFVADGFYISQLITQERRVSMSKTKKRCICSAVALVLAAAAVVVVAIRRRRG